MLVGASERHDRRRRTSGPARARCLLARSAPWDGGHPSRSGLASPRSPRTGAEGPRVPQGPRRRRQRSTPSTTPVPRRPTPRPMSLFCAKSAISSQSPSFPGRHREHRPGDRHGRRAQRADVARRGPTGLRAARTEARKKCRRNITAARAPSTTWFAGSIRVSAAPKLPEIDDVGLMEDERPSGFTANKARCVRGSVIAALKQSGPGSMARTPAPRFQLNQWRRGAKAAARRPRVSEWASGPGCRATVETPASPR